MDKCEAWLAVVMCVACISVGVVLLVEADDRDETGDYTQTTCVLQHYNVTPFRCCVLTQKRCVRTCAFPTCADMLETTQEGECCGGGCCYKHSKCLTPRAPCECYEDGVKQYRSVCGTCQHVDLFFLRNDTMACMHRRDCGMNDASCVQRVQEELPLNTSVPCWYRNATACTTRFSSPPGSDRGLVAGGIVLVVVAFLCCVFVCSLHFKASQPREPPMPQEIVLV